MRRIALSILFVMTAVSVNAGPKWELGEDSWMKAGFLGQAHYSVPDNAAYDRDFYMRRARIILMGQITDGVKFFAETDNDKAGKNGTTVSTDIQDAFIDIRLLQADESELWVEAGLIIVPFSYESFSSAASLLGLDYNAESIKLVNTFAWRDNGAMLHGNVGKRVDLRFGAFDGYDTAGSSKSDKAGMRYTGHAGVNLIGDAQTGWFASQNQLGTKGTYLSIGAGFDQQDAATAVMTTDAAGIENETSQQDSSAWVADFQSGMSLTEKALLTVNGAYYDWDSAVYAGNTAFIETGLLVDKVQVTYKLSLADPDGASSTADHTVGLHFFQKGQNVRYGIEYRSGDSDDWALLGVQFLL